MSEEETVIINEFRIEDIPPSCTWIVIGPPGTGKTTFIENMMYYNKHKYPVGRFFMGSPTGYKRFCDITHPLMVSNYYDLEEEHQHSLRQQKCYLENGRDYVGNFAINVIDDAGDAALFKSKLMIQLFTLGSQHWNQLLMIGNQYAIDMPPQIRKSVSYVALFRELEPLEIEKLYKNFGGVIGNKQHFYDIMKNITNEKYHCLIIQKRNVESNDISDCVFYFKTEDMSNKKWKFGCKEYHTWCNERYNPNYVEKPYGS